MSAPARLTMPFLSSIRRDPIPYAGLALAMLASAAFLLWLTRGLTFYNDEIGWVVSAPLDYNIGAILRPHNTHLIALPRLIYTTSLHLFGPSYLPIRVIAIGGVLLCAGLFFALARRRVGGVVALAGTLVLLFFGTAWEVTVSPIGIPFLYATALGLGSFLALERGDRRGDVAACVLLVLALACHSIALIFLIGVAVAVLLGEDRLRRAWVFGIPLALFALWWLQAAESPSKGGSLAEPSNITGLPLFAFLSLGAVVDAVLGLNVRPGSGAVVGFNQTPLFNWTLAPVLAVIAIVALALRLRRGAVPRGLWAFGATLLALWLLTGMSAGPGRGPTTQRYLYPGAVALLLVAAEGARRVRFSRWGLVALFVVVAVSVAANVSHALHARQFLAAFSVNLRPTLAMIELAGSDGDPSYRPGRQTPRVSPKHIGVRSSDYLTGVARWGSFAAPIDAVRRAPPPVRNRADVVLARALGVQAVPAPAVGASRSCVTRQSPEDVPQVIELPPGGATLESVGGRSGPVALRRFGDAFSAPAGELPPRGRAVLWIPTDAASDRWWTSVPGGRLRVCALTRESGTGVYCVLSRRLDRAGERFAALRRRGAPAGELDAARREFARLNRVTRAPLLQAAPREIRDDVQTLQLSLVGRVSPADLRAARERVGQFKRRYCGASR